MKISLSLSLYSQPSYDARQAVVTPPATPPFSGALLAGTGPSLEARGAEQRGTSSSPRPAPPPAPISAPPRREGPATVAIAFAAGFQAGSAAATVSHTGQSGVNQYIGSGARRAGGSDGTGGPRGGVVPDPETAQTAPPRIHGSYSRLVFTAYNGRERMRRRFPVVPPHISPHSAPTCPTVREARQRPPVGAAPHEPRLGLPLLQAFSRWPHQDDPDHPLSGLPTAEPAPGGQFDGGGGRGAPGRPRTRYPVSGAAAPYSAAPSRTPERETGFR